MRAQQELQRVATLMFGRRAKVTPFGSFVQGTHLKWSDLDVRILFTGWPSGQESSASRFHLTRLERELSLYTTTLTVRESRLGGRVRVPIVVLHFLDPKSKQILKLDVSCADATEPPPVGYTDRLIRETIRNIPRVLPLVQMVKLWATADQYNYTYENMLSSLGWTVLTLFCLNNKAKVPIVHHVRQQSHYLESLIELGKVQFSDLPFGRIELNQAVAPSGEDMLLFFEFVADLGAECNGVCLSLSTGRITCKDPDEDGDSSPIYIEDPVFRIALNEACNLARNVTNESWKMIHTVIEANRRKLQKWNADLDNLYGTEVRNQVIKAGMLCREELYCNWPTLEQEAWRC